MGVVGVIIKVWKICYGKMEVVSFVIESGRKLAIGAKSEVNVKKCDRGSCICCLFYLRF
jgi:hypothetical protein